VKLIVVSATTIAALYGFYLFTKSKKKNPPFISSAPGKVILFGEHAVVYEKTAIAGSLGLRVYALFEEGDNITLDIPDFGVTCQWTKQDLSPFYQSEFLRNLDVTKPNSSEDFIESIKVLYVGKVPEKAYQAILIFLFLYFVISSKSNSETSLKVQVRSHLPVGMGLGSSAAYAVSLTNGLLTRFNQRICSLKCSECNGKGICKKQRELINSWAFQAEKIAHGTPSGIDNTVSTFGGALTFKRGTTNNIQFLDKIPPLRFLFTNTRVERKTKEWVEKVRQFWLRSKEEAEKHFDEIDSISQKCIKLFESNEKNLYQQLEILVDRNQELLDLIGVNHPALQKVCDITKTVKLHSKLTGAGGGGCALTLLREDVTEIEITQLKGLLKKEGFNCEVVFIGGEGVSLHTKEQVKDVFS